MNKLRLLGGLATFAVATAAWAQPLVYANDLSNNDASGFMKFQVSLGTATSPVLDSDAFFGFDFSVAYPWDGLTYTGGSPLSTTLPAVPGSGLKKALMVRVNKSQLDSPATNNNTSTDCINIVPKIKFAGDYRVEVDMFVQVQSSGTSTQLSMVGAQHNLTSGWFNNWSGRGYAIGMVGDGSSTTDYRFYRGNTQENTVGGGQNPFYKATNTLTTGSNQINNTNTYYGIYLTTAKGYRYAGTVSGRWIRVILTRQGNMVSTAVQDIDQTSGAVVGSPLVISDCDTTQLINNTTSPTPQADGGVWLGMIDPAASPRPVDYPLFTLFANLKVFGTVKTDTLNGTFELGDYTGSYPASVDFQAYDSADQAIGSPITAALRTNDSTLKQDYFIDLPAGTAYVKTRWRSGLTERIDVTGTGPFVSDVVLRNGDVDRDDTVSILDYIKLSSYYEKTSGDADWSTPDGDNVAPEQCDLDGDSAVSILDYIILSSNYDQVGD